MRESACTSITGPFLVKGPPGACHLRDVTTDSVVFTVSLPTATPGFVWWHTDDELLSSWASVTPPSLLVPGHGYQWEHPGGTVPPSVPFFPIVRYGNPSTNVSVGSARMSLNPGDLLSTSLRSGDVALVGLDVAAISPTPVALRCYLNVAFADPSGAADPVVDLANGRFLLCPQATIGPDPLTISDQARTHYPFYLHDTDLTGHRMLLQWLVVHEASGSVIATDVFGSHVLPAEGAAAAVSVGPPPDPSIGAVVPAVPPQVAAIGAAGREQIAALAKAAHLPICSPAETRAILTVAIHQLCGR